MPARLTRLPRPRPPKLYDCVGVHRFDERLQLTNLSGKRVSLPGFSSFRTPVGGGASHGAAPFSVVVPTQIRITVHQQMRASAEFDR